SRERGNLLCAFGRPEQGALPRHSAATTWPRMGEATIPSGRESPMAQRPELATDTFLKELREEVDLSRGAEVLADLLGSTDSLATIWARCPRADWLLAI